MAQHVTSLLGLTLVLVVTLSCLVPHVSPHNFLKESSANLGLGFDILPPREMVTVEGARLLIPCRPITTEKGVVNVTWTNKGRVVNEASRYVLPNGTLLITEVTHEDASQYRCVLRLETYTVVSAPLNLVLAAAGSWQMMPKKASERVGSAVRLTCHMASLPAATVTWYKGSEPLSIVNSRYYQPSPGVLQITNITQEDSGIYKCKGVNPLIDEVYMSPGGLLTVEPGGETYSGGGGVSSSSSSSGRAPPRKPTLLAIPSKVEVQADRRAVLECITDDVSGPELLWSRIDDKKIRQEGVHREGQGSLVFQAVKEYDAGVYNCSVFSPLLRSLVTQMIELSVLKPPKVNITIIPLGGQVPNGESIVRINCSATGLPAPDITWHKDGMAVPFQGRHIFDTLEIGRNFTLEQLAITNIMSSDGGVFQCIAKNRAGVASEGVLLTVKLSPDMPGIARDFSARETTSNSILVSWNPPLPSRNSQYPASIGYVIHYLEISGGTDQEKQVVTNNTSFRISELRPYTRYTIYVRTFAIYLGQTHPLFGEPCEELVIQTRSDVPTMLPIVELEALTPTVLRLKWNLLTQEQARGEVIHQMVQWRRKDAKDFSYKNILPSLNVYEIRDLHPNKMYEARVLAKTAAGYPETKHLTWLKIKMPKGSKDERPAVHLSVNSDNPTQIVVDWELSEDLRSEVFSYGVSYNNTHGSESQKNLEASATSVVLDNLESGTCYSVIVEPMYKRGRENSKTAVSQTICTLALSPPLLPPIIGNARIGVRKVKVKTLNTTSIQVTWRPKGRRIEPEFFTVKVVNLGQQKRSVAAPLYVDANPNGPDTTHTEHGLLNPPPGSPTKSIKESQVISTDEGNVKVKEEMVRYWRVTGQMVILNDLKPLNKYEISVTASTSAVSSMPSKPVQVTTTEGVPTAPLNVSWKAATPKDVDLVWTHPQHINGHLLYYLVTYSHDLLEWKNHTVASHLTTTQIQDLVSNTNYTVHISGVTGGGRGTNTIVYVYINATLVGEPQISTELVIISVVTLFATITCVVVVVLCFRMIRLRRNAASTFQGNGTCRMIYANGLKPSRDHGTELNDYKPMLTSLPSTMHNHHLDTKGGPGSHADGVMVNCLLETNAPSMNQVDVPNENHVLQPDGAGSNNPEDSLDDIDDDDASSRLLQTVSLREPGCSTLKDLDTRFTDECTQVEPSSSSEGAGVVAGTALS